MPQALTNLQVDNDESLAFIRFIESFCRRFEAKGISIQPYGTDSIQKHLTRPLQEQRAIQIGFRNYAELINSAYSELMPEIEPEPSNEYSEADLLRFAARKFDIVLNSDVYSKITNEDIIELYTKDLQQVYRNLSFFNLCSYNLMDLLNYQPYELYERSLQVNHLLLEKQEELSRRAYSLEPISLRHIPRHLMREKFSDKKHSFLIQFKEVYPVYTHSKEYFGLLVLQGAQIVANPNPNIKFI